MPAPLFTKVAEPNVLPPPESFPLKVSPGTALEAVAFTTVKVPAPFMVAVPLNITPEPALFWIVRVSASIASVFSWMVLFPAVVKYPPYPVPSRSGWMVPAPEMLMLLFSNRVCCAPVPLPPAYAAPLSPSSASLSVPVRSIALLVREFSRATESVAVFSMVTGPVNAELLPVSVTMPVELWGTVSRPVPVMLLLTSRFAAVESRKSRAMSWKSFAPALIAPENPELLPPAPLSAAPPPDKVMAFVMTEFSAANSAPPAMPTAPSAGRPAALTAKMPEFTWVPPPYALLMPTTVAPPKERNCAEAVPIALVLRVATL